MKSLKDDNLLEKEDKQPVQHSMLTTALVLMFVMGVVLSLLIFAPQLLLFIALVVFGVLLVIRARKGLHQPNSKK